MQTCTGEGRASTTLMFSLRFHSTTTCYKDMEVPSRGCSAVPPHVSRFIGLVPHAQARKYVVELGFRWTWWKRGPKISISVSLKISNKIFTQGTHLRFSDILFGLFVWEESRPGPLVVRLFRHRPYMADGRGAYAAAVSDVKRSYPAPSYVEQQRSDHMRSPQADSLCEP
jgi:hypothetical protein